MHMGGVEGPPVRMSGKLGSLYVYCHSKQAGRKKPNQRELKGKQIRGMQTFILVIILLNSF